ncbi:hypothetical protein CLU83_1240 [Flavobacterium sp. 1]|uniref:DUF6252 family protein n=1 Tax=Flavobacterium sp. 1 TaxID=2035200 RepID=UPI000C246C88|nr:DUF6252 family protein [Flavobacterium sp. 1]PJJ08011.1 hypothetical protein CLU83_1240 [Flavobacterium sp. 1]
MKKISILFLAILASVFVLNSCSKDEKIDDVADVEKDGTLKVDFDGKTFISTTVQAIVNDNYISITGLRAPNGDFIQITLPTNKVGTYTWKSFNNFDDTLGLVYTPAGGSNSFICAPKEEVDASLDYTDTGSLTISSIDNTTKKISGTFQFTGVDFMANKGKGEAKIFTKGVFTNISFTSDVNPNPTPNPTPTPSSNTFSAKLDGVAFVPTNIFAILQNNKIAISARKGSVETIGLFLPSTVKAGTYAVEAYGLDYSFLYNKDMTANGTFTGAGSVTITSHDTSKKIIKGTFTSKYTSLLVKDTHNATEGAFSISY